MRLPLAITGSAAAAGFAVIARRVARHETAYCDGRVRRRVPRRRPRAADRAAKAYGAIGKDWVHPVIAAAAAAVVWRARGPRAAAAIPLASAAGIGASHALERLLPHRDPPPTRRPRTNPSFPSGHSLQTAAVALTAGYVLAREEMVPTAVAAPIAVAIPLLSGAAKLYRDRHWVTDVAGGLLAGLAVAAGATVLYEGLTDGD